MSTIRDLSWMIGGPQGSGVDSSANLFARACAVAGYWVYGKREYHSNIKGAHSYFHVRIKHEPVHSNIDPVHVLATFEDSTASIHGHEILENGALVYDPAVTKPEHLELHSSVLKFPLPYDDIINKMAEETGSHPSKLAIMKNTIAVAASAALLRLEISAIQEALEGMFTGRKAKLVPLNMKAAELAYEAIKQSPDFDKYEFRLEPVASKPARESRFVMNGATATGLGKLKAGCRFQTYYSITPAVDECIFLENHSEYGIIVMQCEDELSAINMAVSAGIVGARSSTATSGPGFSLMAEGTGWAGISEIPLVLFNYQRGGPSTGLPTRNEQGELLFAINFGHGEFPKVVIAPGDMHECFEDGFYSFNYADRYQTPIIVLVDKALANCTQTIERFQEDGLVIDRGAVVDADPDFDPNEPTTGLKTFKRYAVTEDGISPRALPGTPGRIYWMTGDEHTEIGHITEDPKIRVDMHEKRMRKLDLALAEIPQERQYILHGPEEADLTIVSWGSTKGVTLDAMKTLKEDHNITVNFLQIRLMNPFPVDAVTEILSKAKRLAIMEANMTAQLGQLIRMRTGIEIPHQVLKYTGRPISQCEVVESVQEILGQNSRKVVLTRGH